MTVVGKKELCCANILIIISFHSPSCDQYRHESFTIAKKITHYSVHKYLFSIHAHTYYKSVFHISDIAPVFSRHVIMILIIVTFSALQESIAFL